MLTDCLWHIDGHHTPSRSSRGQSPLSLARSLVTICLNAPSTEKELPPICRRTFWRQLISRSLFSLLQKSYWKRQPWQNFGSGVFCWHSSSICWLPGKAEQEIKAEACFSWLCQAALESITLTYVKATTSGLFPLFRELSCTLEAVQPYEHVFLNELCPGDPRRRYEFIQSLQRTGVESSVVLCTPSSGNNTGNMHFGVYQRMRDWKGIYPESVCYWIYSTTVSCFSHTNHGKSHVFQVRTNHPLRETSCVAILFPLLNRRFYCCKCHGERGSWCKGQRISTNGAWWPSNYFDLHQVQCPKKKTKYEVFGAEA